MKKLLFSFSLLIFGRNSFSQSQNYCDFESNTVVMFGFDHTGTLDTMAANPAPDMTDSSAHCTKYIRSTLSYDYVKMYPLQNLIDITLWADSLPTTPKITATIFSTAPIGTQTILQFGSKRDQNYPSGIHSEYISKTRKQNAWEVDTFFFFQKPAGGYSHSDSINKIVLLPNPNSNNPSTIYFDNLTGPALTPAIGGISQVQSYPPVQLYGNSPNPANGKTTIDFEINSSGSVSLKIFDLLGNLISTPIEKEMKAGKYSVPVEMNNLPSGIYFYELKKDNFSQTKKLIVAR